MKQFLNEDGEGGGEATASDSTPNSVSYATLGTFIHPFKFGEVFVRNGKVERRHRKALHKHVSKKKKKGKK